MHEKCTCVADADTRHLLRSKGTYMCAFASHHTYKVCQRNEIALLYPAVPDKKITSTWYYNYNCCGTCNNTIRSHRWPVTEKHRTHAVSTYRASKASATKRTSRGPRGGQGCCCCCYCCCVSLLLCCCCAADAAAVVLICRWVVRFVCVQGVLSL